MDKVLVTGGSGFIAMHTIERLWAHKTQVFTTVRSLDKKQIMEAFAKSHQKTIQTTIADLCSDQGWDDAAKGMDYIIHIASPFPDEPVADEQTLIQPALEGTRRVLEAAVKNQVKRIVLVSSIVAVAFGRRDKKNFTADDWSDIHGEGIDAYQKSKTLAEQYAWEFMGRPENKGTELVVINPGLVLGPRLGKGVSSSNKIIQKMVEGVYPGCPNIQVAVVDVRDISWALVTSMKEKNAAGKRFLMADKNYWIKDIAKLLSHHGFKHVATRSLPDWIFWFLGFFDKKMKQVCVYLGMEKYYDGKPAKTILRWKPTDGDKTILAAARDIIKKT